VVLSTSQAAKVAKVKQVKIVREIKLGRLKASRIGWVYLIKKSDLKAWQREQS